MYEITYFVGGGGADWGNGMILQMNAEHQYTVTTSFPNNSLFARYSIFNPYSLHLGMDKTMKI